MNSRSPLFKLALLSISLFLASAPAVAPLIPLMEESYPALSKSSIEMITTMPNFGIMLFVLVSPFVSQRIGKKKCVLLGLAIALVAGVVPVFADSYPILLVSRFLFGAGLGLYNSLAVSLITETYEGREQATMVGWQAAAGSIGSTVLTLIMGHAAAVVGWQTSFAGYGLMVLPLVLFAVCVKIPPEEDRPVSDGKKGGQQHVTAPIVVLTLLAIVVFASFFTVMIKTASLLVEQGIGTAADAANALGMLTIVGIAIDAFYGRIVARIERVILPAGLIGMGLSFLLISSAASLAAVTAGVLLSGFFYFLAAPYMFMLVSKVAPKNSVTLATGIYLFGINFGIFLSPYFNAALELLIHSSAAASAFLANGVLICVLGVAVIPMLAGLRKRIAAEQAEG